MFPFSFQEYCQYYDDVSDKDKLFDDYAIKGGLAGSYACLLYTSSVAYSDIFRNVECC